MAYAAKPMVFEGKPLNSKTEEVSKEDPTTETKEEPKIEIKEELPKTEAKTPKKKTHRFRNFLLTTVSLAAVVYGAGAYYALENDDVHDFFVDYVPFGDELMAVIENRRFRKRFSDLAAVQQSNVRTPGGLESVRVSKTGATWKAIDEPVDKPGAINIMKPGPHLSAAKKEETAAPPQKVTLPLVPIPENADGHVLASVEALNDFIKSINESKPGSEHVDRVSKEVVALAQSISEIKDSYKAELASKVEGEAAKALDVVSDKTQELREAIAVQEAKWTAEFREEKKRLDASYNERLKNEIEAANNVIATHAANQLVAVHAEAERQFADEIANRIEKERDGRLANLEQLAKTLSEVEEITVKADKVILESDNTAQLHIAIGRLKTILEGEEPVALGPYIKAIAKVAGKDPLLQAALDSFPSDVYGEGVLTPAQLAARFHLLEPEIRKASLLPPNAGIAGHLGSLLFSKLLWTKTDSASASATDVESILARANAALAEGRVADAVGEVNSLKGWPKRLAADWLADGRKRSEVEFLVDVFSEEGKLWGLEI